MKVKYVIAEPTTRHIARKRQAQNEIANQSVIEIDDLTKINNRIWYYISR